MSRFIVEADGGSRGNPGVAGYGALVRDPVTRAVLAERAAPLGHASNNVAEYTGLIEGLRAAAHLDPGADIEVRMDSKLVVEQMNGRWKIKHPGMRELAGRAREIAGAIIAAGGSVRYAWVPRAQNAAADTLSNKGMDGERISTDHQVPLPGGAAGGVPAGDIPVRARPGDPAAAAVGPVPGPGAPDLGPPTRILLVRHAVTDDTVAGRVTGRGGSDPALNALGTQQARRAAAAVRDIVRDGEQVTVVTSTLARARGTGALISEALGVSARTDEAWDEVDLGEWDGLTWAQIAQRAPGELARIRDERFVIPGGESFAQVRERVAAAFARYATGDRLVVIVSHNGALQALLSHLLGVDFTIASRLSLSPASLTWVRVWADGGYAIDRINDDAHQR